MSFEYKTVGAPEKGKRKRGARTPSDRAAAAFEEILEDEATDGWEYLRTDILPLTERRGWFGGSHEVHRAVMVFRRSLDHAAPGSVTGARRTQFDEAEPLVRTEPAPTGLLASEPRSGRREPDIGGARREPDVSADPDRLLAEVVRGPGKARPQDR